VEPDPSVFLNYGIAGLILLVFYMLFRNELHDLKQAIMQLTMTVSSLKGVIDRHTALLELVLDELRRRNGRSKN